MRNLLLAVLCVIWWTPPGFAQPAPVDRHSAIFDSLGKRVILYAGYDSAPRSDLWSLTLAGGPHWMALSPSGALPAARFGHSAIYDPLRQRMIVFGGITTAATNELWELSLGDTLAWRPLSAAGTFPNVRAYHCAVYDPVRDRMWVFAGGDGIFTNYNDLWSLSLSGSRRWDAVAPKGTPPPRRVTASAIYDPVRDRMIVFGGEPRISGVWQLSFADTSWSLLATAGSEPALRNSHSAIYDPVGDRMIVFGGNELNQKANDTWALSLSEPLTWTELHPTFGPPSPRAGHVAIYDPDHRAMVVHGGFPLGTENLWALSLGSNPIWSPERPVLSVSTDELLLPTVTIGDTATVSFSLANLGLDVLDVSSIQLPGGDLVLSQAGPLTLDWKEGIEETLTLAARVPRTAHDSIVVVSNDPGSPNRSVKASIDVRDLGAESRVLGDPTEVPLGESFIVVVTPDPGVRVERGMLFYRVAGESLFDSLAITPLASDFIAAVPASAVTERGVEYYVEVHNDPFRATEPPGAPAGTMFQAVEPARSFSVAPRPTSGAQFLEGRPIVVEIQLPQGATAVSGTIHFREGGASAFQEASLSSDVLGRPIVTIPAQVVESRGVEYWIDVSTERSTLRYPSVVGATATIRTRVQNLVEPVQHAGLRYRMMSVPLDLGVDFAGSLDDLLADDLGTYDPVRWRAYRYDPVARATVEFSASQSASFRPRPGRAFWLIARDAHRIDSGPVEGTSTDTQSPYVIALEPGWNQIGNPFDFPVAWADVVKDTINVLPPVAFDPSLGALGGYASVTPAVLEPFEGYFVENVGTSVETLSIPPRADSASMARPGSSEPRAVAGERADRATTSWVLRIGARSDGAADTFNDLGIDPRAADGFDALDLRKPPVAPGPWVRLAFANAWERMPGDYRRDLRSPGEGHTWEIELLCDQANETLAIDLAALGPLPDELAMRIVDRELGRSIDIDREKISSNAETAADDGVYRVVSYGPRRAYRLAVVAGTRDYVEHAGEPVRIPTRLTLAPAAPNPFDRSARIRFALPRATAASVHVYSVMGERIATLLDHARLEAGEHVVVWDGHRSEGGQAPSGVYLVRVVTDQETSSRRLVRVR